MRKCIPADFIGDNLIIQNNVIQAAHNAGVQKLLFLGSSCIYPKLAVQPIVEESLLTGALEPTKRTYALLKLLALRLCESLTANMAENIAASCPLTCMVKMITFTSKFPCNSCYAAALSSSGY